MRPGSQHPAWRPARPGPPLFSASRWETTASVRARRAHALRKVGGSGARRPAEREAGIPEGAEAAREGPENGCCVRTGELCGGSGRRRETRRWGGLGGQKEPARLGLGGDREKADPATPGPGWGLRTPACS